MINVAIYVLLWKFTQQNATFSVQNFAQQAQSGPKLHLFVSNCENFPNWKHKIETNFDKYQFVKEILKKYFEYLPNWRDFVQSGHAGLEVKSLTSAGRQISMLMCGSNDSIDIDKKIAADDDVDDDDCVLLLTGRLGTDLW